jgi:hypothetical protein
VDFRPSARAVCAASRYNLRWRVPQKSSPIDRYAAKIAAGIARGRQTSDLPDLVQYVENSSTEIFAAFNGAARHMPPAGDDEALAFGYLSLLRAILEQLRYRIDRGHTVVEIRAPLASEHVGNPYVLD